MKLFYLVGLATLIPVFLFGQINIQINTTQVSCFGGNNGAAQALASGGTSPYTYSWSSGGQTSNISSLTEGTYTVTVTDIVGISATKSTVITQPPPLGATLNGQPQICDVAPDGFAYTIPTGGTPPYTYYWSNGIIKQLNNLIVANTYTVTVTDTRGCTATGSYVVGYLGVGLYLFTSAEKAICPNPDNGTASVNALSGTAPYQYLWSTGATTAAIDHLNPQTYTVTVSDANGCSATKSTTVEREDVDPNYVKILQPQCLGETLDLLSTPDYQVYEWTMNDPADIIVDGDGTHQIKVRWGAPGPKQISVSISDPSTQCTTGTLFEADVYICAVGTQTPFLEGIQVSPNPFGRFIEVEGSEFIKPGTTAYLFNLKGQQLYQHRIEEGEIQIDTHDLPPGAYLLRLASDLTSKTVKLIKE